jgi:hypothetical protein
VVEQAKHVSVPKGGTWSSSFWGQFGTVAGPKNDNKWIVAEGGSEGSVIWDIEVLPLGTNAQAARLYIYLTEPSSGITRLIASTALPATTAPAAGAQFSSPANGVIKLTTLLPVCSFPSTTGILLRKLELAPRAQLEIAGDRPPAGAGWWINFYGGDY